MTQQVGWTISRFIVLLSALLLGAPRIALAKDKELYRPKADVAKTMTLAQALSVITQTTPNLQHMEDRGTATRVSFRSRAIAIEWMETDGTKVVRTKGISEINPVLMYNGGATYIPAGSNSLDALVYFWQKHSEPWLKQFVDALYILKQNFEQGLQPETIPQSQPCSTIPEEARRYAVRAETQAKARALLPSCGALRASDPHIPFVW